MKKQDKLSILAIIDFLTELDISAINLKKCLRRSYGNKTTHLQIFLKLLCYKLFILPTMSILDSNIGAIQILNRQILWRPLQLTVIQCY